MASLPTDYQGNTVRYIGEDGHDGHNNGFGTDFDLLVNAVARALRTSQPRFEDNIGKHDIAKNMRSMSLQPRAPAFDPREWVKQPIDEYRRMFEMVMDTYEVPRKDFGNCLLAALKGDALAMASDMRDVDRKDYITLWYRLVNTFAPNQVRASHTDAIFSMYAWPTHPNFWLNQKIDACARENVSEDQAQKFVLNSLHRLLPEDWMEVISARSVRNFHDLRTEMTNRWEGMQYRESKKILPRVHKSDKAPLFYVADEERQLSLTNSNDDYNEKATSVAEEIAVYILRYPGQCIHCMGITNPVHQLTDCPHKNLTKSDALAAAILNGTAKPQFSTGVKD